MYNEAQIEQNFIEILCQRENQWTYRKDIKSEAALWENLRGHINRINVARLDGEKLTDKEFSQLKVEFRRLTENPYSASRWLRGENGIAWITIEREDPSKEPVNLILFSNKDIAGGISSYKVVNQIKPDAGADLRGDVTFLINGLPVIHIELKAESAKDGYMQAFKQIKRYAASGFFDGIFATTQIFVVSNKVSAKYFARPNSNSEEAFDRAAGFLFNWRTTDNEPVENLYDFARKVLSIPMAHELISRYTILVDDKKDQKFLMVLRPYQIHAIQRIIKEAAKHQGGFIWHATGSGKTITSFVATKLLAQASVGVDRTIMVVDRTDLDSQTKGEFSKFASEYHTGMTSRNVIENALIVGVDNQRQLTQSLLSKKNNNTIIITTIQKLSAAIRKAREEENNKFEKLKSEHLVFVVDECHRAVSDEQMKEITVVLILKKNRENRDVFFIDASSGFEKQKNQNFLRPEDIEKIVNAYKKRESVEKYAHFASYQEIIENDYNLNIPRYVDTFEEEEPIDIVALSKEIQEINAEIEKSEKEFLGMLDELAVTDETREIIEATKGIFG